jgi:hypothetical protein
MAETNGNYLKAGMMAKTCPDCQRTIGSRSLCGHLRLKHGFSMERSQELTKTTEAFTYSGNPDNPKCVSAGAPAPASRPNPTPPTGATSAAANPLPPPAVSHPEPKPERTPVEEVKSEKSEVKSDDRPAPRARPWDRMRVALLGA